MLIQGKSNTPSDVSPPNQSNTYRTHVSSRSLSTPTLPVSIPCSNSARPLAVSPNKSTTGTSPKRNRLYELLNPLVVPKVRKTSTGSNSSSLGSDVETPTDVTNSMNRIAPPQQQQPTPSKISFRTPHLKQNASYSSYIQDAARYDPSTDGIGAEYIPGSVIGPFDGDGDVVMDIGSSSTTASTVTHTPDPAANIDFDTAMDSTNISPNTSRRTSAAATTSSRRPSALSKSTTFSALSRGFADELTLGIIDKPKPSDAKKSSENISSASATSGSFPHNNSFHNQPSEYSDEIVQFSPIDISSDLLSSPTLGLSETDWKKISFSTRRKLKSAVETGSSVNIPLKELPPQLSSSLKSPPVSRTGSMNNNNSNNNYNWPATPQPSSTSISSATSSPKHPFTRRLREKSATMYPALGHIDESLGGGGVGLRSVFNNESLPKRSSLSRSTSLSNNSTYSESPAFQFLSRFSSLNSDSTTSGLANSRNVSFILGTASPKAYSYSNDPELGEQVGSYFLGKMIGYGGFSQVREAHTIDEDTGKKVIRAVKIVKKVHPTSSVEDMERVQNEFDHEVSLWKTLQHPHILKLLFVEDNERATYCFTERITGGTLFDLVKTTRGRNLDYDALKRYIFELGTALLYLHETKFIVHRDVKLENCLLEDIGNGQHKILLCDFGLSDYYGKSTSNSRNSSSLNLANSNLTSEYDSLSTSPQSSRSILTSTSSGSERSMNLVIGPSETSSTLTHHRSSAPNNTTSPSNNPSSNHTSNSIPTPTTLRRRSTSPARMFATTPKEPSSITTANGGSMPYASPQLLRSASPILHPSVDMWAFGVVIFALYMGQLPWTHPLPPILRSMIENNPYDEESLLQKVGPQMSQIVSGCLTKDQTQRSTIRDVIYHPLFSDLYQEHSEVLK